MRNGNYEMMIAPAEYPGTRYRGRYCYEHHLVWWRYAGELAVADEKVIHHINGDMRDNRLENLQMVTVSEHSIIHSTGKTYMPLVCAGCGVEFERECRNVNWKIGNGQRNFFCSRSCSQNFQRKT